MSEQQPEFEAESSLRDLPWASPPPGLSRRILADLPRYHGWLGHLQYALLKPRWFPPATLAPVFMLVALLQLALAAALFYYLPMANALFPVSAWLALQPPLLAMLAVLPLLAAVQVRSRQSAPALMPLLLYCLLMTVNALFPLFIEKNLFLGLAGLGLLPLPLLSAGLLALVRPLSESWRTAHGIEQIAICRP